MTTASNTLESLLTEHDVVRITRLSLASIRRWRLLRQGPPFVKLGAAVRYRPGDLNSWLASRPTGGAEIPPGPSRTPTSISVTGSHSRLESKNPPDGYQGTL
jgi:predicted DNA-binding transcriptional regulator AlpA